MEDEPDFRYSAGEMLLGGLKEICTRGPEHAHYPLWHERSPALLFCPDLFMCHADSELTFTEI